jgi:hypothetical protein
MGMTTAIITFGSLAVQFPAPGDLPLVHTVLAEPLRTNAHVSYVGGSNVTNDGSGTGVSRELAQPGAATVPVDQFSYQPSTDGNRVDPTIFYAHGTTGEKLLLTYLKV